MGCLCAQHLFVQVRSCTHSIYAVFLIITPMKPSVTFLLILTLFTFSTCKKVDVPDDTPRAIKKIVREFQEQSKTNPPASVVEYSFEGRKVYYVPPRCCDIPSTLFDSKGEVICHPDGGLSGGGDGACPSFFADRSEERLIWKDKR